MIKEDRPPKRVIEQLSYFLEESNIVRPSSWPLAWIFLIEIRII